MTYMQMLSSVSAKACCLMHTVAANCSLSSTDVDGANAKNRLSYQILKWMEYRALEMNHYEPFFWISMLVMQENCNCLIIGMVEKCTSYASQLKNRIS